MMELVYVFASKAKLCGFESHSGDYNGKVNSTNGVQA